jgi:flagellin-like hook-associated protein FlgL
MSSDIVLTAGIRQNLLSLQETTQLQQTTQERLSSGKKVNSALDNAVNYFTASALSARGNELSSLLDSMTNGVNTLKAADNGLTSITTTIQSMQATVTQARQDASWQSSLYTVDAAAVGTSPAKTLSFSGGAVGSTAVSVSLNQQQSVSGTYTAPTAAENLTITAPDINGGNAVTVFIGSSDSVSTVAANINTAVGYSLASVSGGTLTLSDYAQQPITLGGSATGAGGIGLSATTSSWASGGVNTVDQMVAAINANTQLANKVKASNNAGQLMITNLSVSSLTVTGISASSGQIDGSAGTASIGGNTVRFNLIAQFNELRDQLDKTAADSSFNGVNLLSGNVLKLFFNELGTSTLSIQSTNPNGISSSVLGITAATGAEFQDNNQLDARLQQLQTALGSVAAQASDFGSNLSIVQNRQSFTNNMINTLQTGADGLTLADTNEEGANMLALQTRQQLSVTALSLASQANQSVLKLFG